MVNHRFHRDTDGKRRVKSKRQGGEVEGGRKETDPFAKCSSTVFAPFLDALIPPSLVTRLRKGGFSRTRRVGLL